MGLVAVLGFVSGTAHAEPDKVACVDAHTHGQELRLAGKWVEARARFRTCAAGSCPRPVTLDCTRWLEELRGAMPSVLFAAKDPNGSDTVDVRLLVDGVLVASTLPTTSYDLDPGEHAVRVEHPGWPAVEQHVVVRADEKDKRITFVFPPNRPLAAKPASADGKEPASASSSSSSVGVVMLGAGAALAAAAITFAVLGRVRETDLASQPCGQNGTCSHADVDVVRRDYWIAGVAGGVGAVALGIGIWRF